MPDHEKDSPRPWYYPTALWAWIGRPERHCISPGCSNLIPAILNWCDDHDPYHDNPPLGGSDA